MFDYKQKYATWDVETEGLNYKYSRPWELSYMICEGNNILTKKQCYIDLPNFNLSPLIRKLCNFNEAEYNAKKRPPKEVWGEFKEFLYDEQYMPLGQNILNFDIFILGILAELAGDKIDYSFVQRCLDTRPFAIAEQNGIEKPRSGSLIEWQYKILNDRSLKAKASQLALLKYFGIEFDEKSLHSGLYDIQMTWEIFKQLKKALKL